MPSWRTGKKRSAQGRGQASTPPVPQRDEGSTIKKSFTDGPQHGKGVHHHGRLKGLGAVLVINDRVIDTVASPVTEMDAKALDFELGSSSSQGVVEALAIIMALQHWGNKLAGMNVQITIQSDSVTALATTLKKSGASAAQNFCGAVLGVLLERYRVEDARLQHIPGAVNKVADYLSRPSMWDKSPRPPEIKEGNISANVVRVTIFTLCQPRADAQNCGASRTTRTPTGPWMAWQS